MKKILIGMISVMMVLGLSVPSMAAWVSDPTGDTALGVTSYDIQRAKVEVFPTGTGLEEYMNICIDMTGSLPGAIYMEFNVDPDVGQPVSLLSLFNPCTNLSTPYVAAGVGADMNLAIFLRDQTSDAASAYCDSCYGPPPGTTCMERDGTACGQQPSGECNEANCYTAGSECAAGTAGCYVRGAVCTEDTTEQCKITQGTCSQLVDDCAPPVSCNSPKIRGEWIANHMFGSGGMARPTERGRFDMPLPKGPGDTPPELCVTIPWKRIVESSYTQSYTLAPVGPKFNKTLAETPANIKWQLGTYFKTDENDDFITYVTNPTPPPAETSCLPITDAIPNAGWQAGADAVTGGMVTRLKVRSEYAMTKMAAGAEMDYDVCKVITNQGTCEAAGCRWYSAPSGMPCMLKMPIMDWDKISIDGIGSIDFGIFKREQGRLDP